MTTKTGRLYATSTNSAGKKIDEWTYQSGFGEKHRCVVKVFGDHTGLKFRAYAMKDGTSAQGRPLKSVTEIFEPIEETDIKRLKEKVEEAYNIHDSVSHSANWEDWLEVKVSRRASLFEGLTGDEIAIGYRQIKKATLPDGKQVTISRFDNRITTFPLPKKQGEDDEGQQATGASRLSSGRDVNSEYAYLPSTPQNVATLESMQAGLRELHARVCAFVSAGARVGVLDASSFKALPSPSAPDSI